MSSFFSVLLCFSKFSQGFFFFFFFFFFFVLRKISVDTLFVVVVQLAKSLRCRGSQGTKL